MSRFDYGTCSKANWLRYDDIAIADQAAFKASCENLEIEINKLKPGRATSLALTKLEEVYMWLSKAIHDEQIARNGSAPLQDERTNS